MANYSNGYTVSPTSQSANVGATLTFTITLIFDSPGTITTNVNFSLSDDGSGFFSPGNSVTVLAGQSSVSFGYQNTNSGAKTLTVVGSGQPFLISSATARAVFSGAIISISPGGSRMISQGIIQAAGMEWFRGYVVGRRLDGTMLRWAKLNSFDLKDTVSLKEAMGPESDLPVAVGMTERKMTCQLDLMTVDLARYQMCRGGGAPAAWTAVLTPTVALTLAAAVLSGTAPAVPLAAGFIAVAYSYTNRFGETVIGTIQTVSVTAGQQINVSGVTFPTNASGVNIYMSSGSFSTAPQALAAPLYLLANLTSATGTIVTYPIALTIPPLLSSISTTGLQLFQSFGDDEPQVFDLLLDTPADGSGRAILAYGVIIPDMNDTMKLREWTSEKITAHIYGRCINGRMLLYEQIMGYSTGTSC